MVINTIQVTTMVINHNIRMNKTFIGLLALYIYDRACENQPCKRKLHRVIFSPISLALNVVSHFHKF